MKRREVLHIHVFNATAHIQKKRLERVADVVDDEVGKNVDITCYEHEKSRFVADYKHVFCKKRQFLNKNAVLAIFSVKKAYILESIC